MTLYSIQFNILNGIHIQLEKNRMQISGEIGCWKYDPEYGVAFFLIKNIHRFEKTFFHVSLFGNGLNKF